MAIFLTTASVCNAVIRWYDNSWQLLHLALYPVTAPSEAEDTSLAYLAKTPVV